MAFDLILFRVFNSSRLSLLLFGSYIFPVFMLVVGKTILSKHRRKTIKAQQTDVGFPILVYWSIDVIHSFDADNWCIIIICAWRLLINCLFLYVSGLSKNSIKFIGFTQMQWYCAELFSDRHLPITPCKRSDIYQSIIFIYSIKLIKD